jgi:ABC-type branched-subunit amino acid transport system substrate-binding protein
MRKRFTLCCLLLIACLAGCSVRRVTRPVIKIGLVAPFEGSYRYAGYDAIYAARLALRETNAAGGVEGYTVELVAYDDQGDVGGARVAARNLAQDPQLVAVIGHFRDETTAAAQELYAQNDLPLLVAGTVEGGMAERGDWPCPLLVYLGKERAVRSVGILSSAGLFLSCAAGPELIVVQEGQALPDVDAVLLDLDPVAAGEALLALREAGWEGVVAGGPILGSPLFTQLAGEFATGVFFISLYRWPDVEGRDAGFGVAYQSLGPHVPRPGPFALTTYQATQALLSAIEATSHAGETPTRQTIALHLARPASDTLYIYRWTASGTPELMYP